MQTEDYPASDDHGRRFVTGRHRFPANAAGFLLAPVTWFVYFMAVYALQGAGCAAGLDRMSVLGIGGLQLLLLLTTLLAVAVIGAAGLWSFRTWRRLQDEPEGDRQQPHANAVFLSYGALLHAALFLVATLWTGIPILLVDACDMLGSA